MSFVKREYSPGQTTITSENLNAIQDELIRLGQDKYEKPSGGIPKTDLADAVKTSLGKADTALQQHQSLAAYRTATAQDAIDAAQNTEIGKKYTKPGGGIPKTDLADAVKTSLDKADTALQQHQSLAAYRTAAAQDAIDAAQNTEIGKKYTKPEGGVPKTDLADPVKTSLDKADSALQQHQSLAAYRTAAAQDEIDAAQNTEIAKKANAEDVYDKEAVNARDDALYKAILTGGGDYKATMRSFFLANGALLLTDLTDLCDRWYELSRTGWLGGVRFNQPQDGVTMSSDGTKTGDNAGLVCTPSTPAAANRDDYAALPLFAVVDCNVTLDDDGKPHVTAIDGIAGSFKRTDPAAIVCCMQMTGWMRAVEDADVFGFDYTDQSGLEGFVPLPEAVELKDNAVRSWVVHCKYGAGDAWGSCSGVPLRVWDVSHNNARTQVRSAWNYRYCAATSADDAFLKRMLYLKYGQLDSDRVLHGCVNYNYDYTPALAETGVERILVTPAQAATLIVGSTVCYGASARANGSTVDRKKITAIETVTIGGTNYGAVYVDNGGTTFDTATNGHLTTMQWWTGSTDAVQGNDGGINPADDRYPVKLQGIEILSGCYEVMGDTILCYEVSDGVQCEVAHVCRDASKINTGVTADYKTCAYGMPCPASSSWQYPKRLGHDAALPEVMLGSVSGGSSTSGPRDGFFIEKYSADAVREWLRWGTLNNGLGNAGLSCGRGGNGLGRGLVHRRAAFRDREQG